VQTPAEPVGDESGWRAPPTAATTASYYVSVYVVKRTVMVAVQWTGPTPALFRGEVVAVDKVRVQPPTPWPLIWDERFGEDRRLDSGGPAVPIKVATLESVDGPLSLMHFVTARGRITVEPDWVLDAWDDPVDWQGVEVRLRFVCDGVPEDFTILATIFNEYALVQIYSVPAMEALVDRHMAKWNLTDADDP
jgi:hypothetical protein